MAADTACPVSAVYGPVAQPARHAVFFAYQVVDRCRELAVYLKNPPKGQLECFKPYDGFRRLRPMDDTVCGNKFVRISTLLLSTTSSK